jgi:hypothetical protein
MFKGFWGSYQSAPGAEGTLWGAFNAVTHAVDHVRGRTYDTRFDSAQFGAGANLKAQAWAKAQAFIDGLKQANTQMLALAS